MTFPLTHEDPAILTARAGLMRAGVSRAAFAPRDTKDGTATGSVWADYIADREAEPTTTVTVEIPA